ncbi:hypothetical protein [Huintestinicola sp.]
MYNDMHRYDDILTRERPRGKRQPMPVSDRAAQFAPFAALTGYDEAVAETARLTDSKIELGEDRAADINDKLCMLRDRLYERPEAEVTYFVPDGRKSGGSYVTLTGNAKRIDEYARTVIFTDGAVIPIDDIFSVKLLGSDEQ